MRRKGVCIDGFTDTVRQFPECLNSVGMKNRSRVDRFYSLRDSVYVVDGADFVIYVNDGNQRSLTVDEG